MEPKKSITPWIIAFIWVSVIALAVQVTRNAKQDRALQQAVQEEFGPDVGLHGIAAVRLTGDQLNVEVTVSMDRSDYENIVYDLARRFGETKKACLGDGSGCVVLLHNGAPVMYLKTKKDGSLLVEPTEGAP